METINKVQLGLCVLAAIEGGGGILGDITEEAPQRTPEDAALLLQSHNEIVRGMTGVDPHWQTDFAEKS